MLKEQSRIQLKMRPQIHSGEKVLVQTASSLWKVGLIEWDWLNKNTFSTLVIGSVRFLLVLHPQLSSKKFFKLLARTALRSIPSPGARAGPKENISPLIPQPYWRMVSGRSVGLWRLRTIHPEEYVHTRALLLNIVTLRLTIMYVQLNHNILVDCACSPPMWINSNAYYQL